ncbi:aminoglycoside phosphotransferase family protein [bacterium]|nr:aminoglycoside phosphotransferase family protein [bacterium]
MHLVRVNERLSTEVGLARFQKARFCAARAASGGIPVPYVSQVGTLDNGRPYSVEGWVGSGIPADTVQEGEKRIILWKKVVAEARKLLSVDLEGKDAIYRFGFDGDGPTKSWAEHCDTVLEALERDDYLGLSSGEKKQLTAALYSLDLTQYPPCLCHGDLKLDNVLVDPETLEVVAVLDWELARRVPSIVGELATMVEPAVLDIKKNAVPQSEAEREAIFAAFGGDQEQLRTDFTIFFAGDVIMNLDDYATALEDKNRPDLALIQQRRDNYVRGLEAFRAALKSSLA